MTTLNNIKLSYFDLRGKAEPIRLLLEDAGVKYHDERVTDFNVWQSKMKPDLERFPFGQMPAMEVDGMKLVQSDAILRYLGRELGYYPTSSKDAAKVDMIMGGMDDFNNAYVRAVYSSDRQDFRKFLDETSTKWLHYFENLVKMSGKTYLSEKLSVADFVMFDFLDKLSIAKPDILNDYPGLKNLKREISCRPHIKDYLSSSRRPSRVNNTDVGGSEFKE